jgi:hypothetical protein
MSLWRIYESNNCFEKKPKIGPKSPNSKKEIEKPLNPFSIVYEDTNSELETLWKSLVEIRHLVKRFHFGYWYTWSETQLGKRFHFGYWNTRSEKFIDNFCFIDSTTVSLYNWSKKKTWWHSGKYIQIPYLDILDRFCLSPTRASAPRNTELVPSFSKKP